MQIRFKIAKLILLLLLLILSFTYCSRQFSYKLSSLEPDKEYYEGREIAIKEDSSFISSLEYDGELGDKLLFYITLINKTDSSVTFFPSCIYALISRNDGLTYTSKSYALDPESELRVIGILKNQARDYYQTAIKNYDFEQSGIYNEYIIRMGELDNYEEFLNENVLFAAELMPDEEAWGVFMIPKNIGDGDFLKIFIPFADKIHVYIYSVKKVK